MSHFWAEWDAASYAPEILRRDTRIFWMPQASFVRTGKCAGTFVGENPGSGRALSGLQHCGPDILVDRHGKPGDPTLRLVLEIWQSSVSIHGLASPGPCDYIEILNTYYFRNPKTGHALSAWRAKGGQAIYFPTFDPDSQFAILGWGVAHNDSAEACRAARTLATHPKVILPSSKGKALSVPGSKLTTPVSPAPPAPSFILNRSKTLRPIYHAQIAALL